MSVYAITFKLSSEIEMQSAMKITVLVKYTFTYYIYICVGLCVCLIWKLTFL